MDAKVTEEIRQRLSALVADMTKTTRELREHGIEPSQCGDDEARKIIKRIVERVYTFEG